MKPILNAMRCAGLVAWATAVAAPSLQAQIIAHPNQIQGTVRFSNVNPAILNLLNPPANQGFTSAVVYAYGNVGGQGLSSYTIVNSASTPTSVAYEVTVESSPGGIEYGVTATVFLDGNNDTYYSQSVTSAPVVFGGPPVTVNVDECASLIDVQFVNGAGNPVSVTGGRILAYPTSTPSSYQAATGGSRSNYTREYLAVRGGQTYTLEITYQTGTDPFDNEIQYRQVVVTNAPCDQIVVVRCVVPSPASLGSILGQVDMLGEFELPLTGYASVGYYDKTLVTAWIGPFGNTRYDSLPGTPPTVPSSGAFILPNLVPSNVETPAVGYSIYAEMAFRTNRQFEFFRTPALGYGNNPSVLVPPGGAVNLSNTFVLNPGYVRGQILLRGPADLPDRPSGLRNLQFSGDYDPNGDGIPDSAAIYGNFWSIVEAVGVDRLAAGATRTAIFGAGVVSFDGAYHAGSQSFAGQYELVLGGLGGERSIWRPDYLGLQFGNNVSLTNPSTYVVNIAGITDRRGPEVEVVPSQAVTNNRAYCFSEVCLRFRSTTGTFFNPRVRFSSGSYTGTDFQGNPADYGVYLDAAFGTPAYQHEAANNGLVVMYVPQGTYTMYPYLSTENPGGGFSETQLPAVELTVGCAQRICLEQCLQLNLNAPECSNTRLVPITGSVRSCGNKVASITYELNGGRPESVCTDCGPDPSFAFDLELRGDCRDNTLVVTTTDVDGGLASVTTTIHYNEVPPAIDCPGDLVVDCQGTNGTVVNFIVKGEEACGGAVMITCDPPSGSVFSSGTNVVSCVATDTCGNISKCSFKVIVRPGPMTIERAICVRWNCGGVLQSADDITGPWTDIPGATSPYCVPASEARRFYRARP
jgi:hypothetical protein